jgi:aldehyde:ferredoxin oxidoreductase
MIPGYNGKIAEVDLTKHQISDFIPEDEILRNYIGGRGLATKILWDRFGDRWAEINPLGPENLLTVLAGPLTGYITGARICVSGKSPLSNGIVGSTAGGEFALELKCAGYDGVIVKGRSETPVYILITDGKVEIRDASELWGLDGKETVLIINKEVRALLEERKPEYGLWKEPGLIYIGPAGENLVRNAAVMQKWSHACGYGGYGAVMGSKNLKAIVSKGTGHMPDVAHPEDLPDLWKTTKEVGFSNPNRDLWGTGASGYSTGADRSAEPVRNWQDEWHDEKSIGVINLETKNWVKRYWSDYGCTRACMKLAVVKTGPFKGAITDNPDYELEAYCGTNLGVFDTDGVIHVSTVVDDLGLSGINSANTMGFAAELYQRGILTEDDLEGIKPVWGDAKAMGELAWLITERRGIGDVLAEGTFRAAKIISELKGVDVMKYAVQFKGIEVGAHGIRTGKHFPLLGYAMSVQGGDHTSIPRPPMNEARSTIGDTMVICNMGMPRGVPDLIWRYLKAVTDLDITQEDWINIYGRRIIQIQRAALLLGGPDVFWDPKKDDDNPPRWYEPLPSGPYEGSAPNRDDVMEQRKTFYAEMGWNEMGIPTSEELNKLGLQNIDITMKPLRNKNA